MPEFKMLLLIVVVYIELKIRLYLMVCLYFSCATTIQNELPENKSYSTINSDNFISNALASLVNQNKVGLISPLSILEMFCELFPNSEASLD